MCILDGLLWGFIDFKVVLYIFLVFILISSGICFFYCTLLFLLVFGRRVYLFSM